MKVQHITPILNVSNLQETFDWFEKLGWNKGWEWGEPAGFGCVCSAHCDIFLCVNGQGGRGRGEGTSTFGSAVAQATDKGVWLSLWVDNVDEVFDRCKSAGIEITWEPTDMEWHVREMHIRHPDGHVFRVSQSLTS